MIALGQTLLNTGTEDLMPLSQSVDAYPERDSQATISGRWSRSANRDEHPSPLRTKTRKKNQSGHRSTGRLGGRELDRVHGNRHVGGCCGHEKQLKPRPPSRSPRGKKQKKTIVISPSRRYEKISAEREEEFANYRSLVEQRFTQMLEDEKARLKRNFNNKKGLLEEKLRFENEERLKALADSMKAEFGHNQRLAENRNNDMLVQKERDLQVRLEETQRRMEQDAIARERAIEEKVQQRMKL